jgi:hypothetical protein
MVFPEIIINVLNVKDQEGMYINIWSIFIFPVEQDILIYVKKKI